MTKKNFIKLLNSLRYSCAVLLCCFGCSAIASNLTQQFNVQNVLGTSADISLSGVSKEQAEKQVALMLAEIKRLESLLSNYQSTSELNQLNSGNFNGVLSPELQQVFTLCEQWQQKSKNAFSCRLGAAQNLWQQAQSAQQLPDRKALRRLSREARKLSVDFSQPVIGKLISGTSLSSSSTITGNLSPKAKATPKISPNINSKVSTQQTSVIFDINGLAKGYIIDHAFNFLKDNLPNLTSLSLDIGGDGRYWQKDKQAFTVGIAQPFNPSDNKVIGQVRISNKAIAASGEGSRHYLIKQQKFHHILNPRDGWPLSNAPGAIVIANNTVTADAVATALNAKPMQAGIDWVNQLDGIEALVISKSGFQLSSQGWHKYPPETNNQNNKPLSDFTFDFTIPVLDIDDYEKPYVAIWLTNSKREVVKHLLLLGKNEQWAQTNKRWWRKSGRHNELLLDGLARPTRKPGTYQLNWDWYDDYGNLVPTGAYQLHIEASREDGELTLTSFDFNTNKLPTIVKKSASGELGQLQLTIKKRS
jgi:thiamine biosynthesis lipoprotein